MATDPRPVPAPSGRVTPQELLDLAVYALADPEKTRGRDLTSLTHAAIRGGATAIQLRAKSLTTRRLVDLAARLLAVTKPRGIPLIVNDRLDVALATGADGVHLGPEDMPPAAARSVIGPDLILGISAGTPAEARAAEAAGADYLGVGDVFGTYSKLDAGVPIGLDGLSAVVAATTLPVVAIGGLSRRNAAWAVQAGASGVAVISAIFGADDVEGATRALRLAVDRALGPGA